MPHEAPPSLAPYVDDLKRCEKLLIRVMSKSTTMTEVKRALAGKLIVAGDRSLAFLALMDSARWRKSLGEQEKMLLKVQRALAHALETETVPEHSSLARTVTRSCEDISESMRFEQLSVPEMGSEERARYEAKLTQLLDGILTEQEERDVEEEFRALVQEVEELADAWERRRPRQNK